MDGLLGWDARAYMHACMQTQIHKFIACEAGWVGRLSCVGWLAWFDWRGGWVGLGRLGLDGLVGWGGWLFGLVGLGLGGFG